MVGSEKAEVVLPIYLMVYQVQGILIEIQGLCRHGFCYAYGLLSWFGPLSSSVNRFLSFEHLKN